jgi:hypothetical protein
VFKELNRGLVQAGSNNNNSVSRRSTILRRGAKNKRTGYQTALKESLSSGLLPAFFPLQENTDVFVIKRRNES